MTIQNAFENLSTEAKQDLILAALAGLLAELNQKLEPGGSINVGNFPATQPVSGPLTDAQLRATSVAVGDGGASLTVDGSQDFRYSGGKVAFVTTTSAAGNTTLITPTLGNRIRVFWVAFVPSTDNSNSNLIKIKFSGGTEIYRGYALAHWEVFTGGVNEALQVNAATIEPVAISIHYQEV